VSGPPAICQGVAALACIAAGAASGGGAPADIHLTASANRARVRIGKPVTIAYRVSNAGPGTATDVGLKIPLGEVWRVASVRTTSGSCAGVRSIFCHLGDLALSKAVTVTVAARPMVTGTLHPRGGLTSSSGDPNPDDNFASGEVTVFDPFTGLQPENHVVHVPEDAFGLRYRCPPSVPKFCRGGVDIVWTRPGPPPPQPGANQVIIGAARLSLPSGVAGRIRVRLNHDGIRLLKKFQRLRVTTITRTRDGARTRATRTAPLKLIGPPKPKKKKKTKP